jgi:hypothetical protein
LICRQISPIDLPSHAISIGAKPQRECPGMLWNEVCWPAKIGTLRSMWQAPQVLPGTPPPSAPRVTGGEWGCMSLPWVGRSLAGWQFMQRGFMITWAASVNSVRERACGSEIAAKAEGGRSSARF